jgi:hypothetical protein
MFWYEPTLLTFCAFMSSVWIDSVVVVTLPDCTATVSTREWILFISQLDLSGATNRARGSAFFFVMVTEFVLHLYLLGRGQLLDCHS